MSKKRFLRSRRTWAKNCGSHKSDEEMVWGGPKMKRILGGCDVKSYKGSS